MTSFKEWCDKHYPIEASELKDATPLEAIRHSLAKWRGLRPAVLEEYGLILHHKAVIAEIKAKGTNDTLMYIDNLSCSLCVQSGPCYKCPFMIEFDSPCDEYVCTEDGAIDCNPWDAWTCNSNPEPMIEALQILEQKYSKLEATKCTH